MVGAALGTFVFIWVAPGSIAGLVPYLITRWRSEPTSPVLRVLAAVLLVLGVAIVIESFVRFVIRGRGTPAPVLPTEELVSSGLYRYVRNPMYVGVLTTIVGQALLLGRPVLFVYAGLIWLMFHTFVLAYEEPALTRQFGDSYLSYRQRVRRWLPTF